MVPDDGQSLFVQVAIACQQAFGPKPVGLALKVGESTTGFLKNQPAGGYVPGFE
jgi:hypothetical protein